METKKLYQTKQFWYVVGGIVLVAIIFAMITMNKSSNPTKGTKTYKDENGNVVSFNPKTYGDDMYQAIYGYVNLDQKAYENLMKLNDTEFTMVAEYWNKEYYSKDKETLRQAIAGEYFITLQDDLQNRFKRLNIS